MNSFPVQFICNWWNINSSLEHELSKEAGCCPSVLYKPAQELEQGQWMFIIFGDTEGERLSFPAVWIALCVALTLRVWSRVLTVKGLDILTSSNTEHW